MSKKLTIAIDGFSACGKSTLARMLAEKLDYIYVDSGAMYRAVTLYYIQHQLNTEQQLIDHLKLIHIGMQRIQGKNITTLNGINVEKQIRSHAVNELVSQLSTISAVRQKLVLEQRQMSKKGGIVMDGRDIGTVVFPDADLKIFLTASIQIRTQRRFEELMAKGIKTTQDRVRKNLIHRDMIDSNRDDSPLVKAVDAIELDNSYLTKEEQLELVLRWIKNLQNMPELDQ